MADRRELSASLRATLRGHVCEDYDLAPHTTYEIGGLADLAVFPLDPEDLRTAVALLDERGYPYILLGGGSNVLISDRGVREAVVFTSDLNRLRVEGHAVLAEAGVESHRVALAALDAGLTGAEFLCWLPGTIGGACYMNARAFGGEISQVLVEARVITRRGEARNARFSPEMFSYKCSPFRESGDLVAEATLWLNAGDAARIRERMEEIERQRRTKHEMDFPSCGCVFKNDHTLGGSSGTIIERCGLKRFRIGDAQVSPFHANFIINHGRATAEEVLRVIAHVRRIVAEQTGHKLELEVQLLGEWDEMERRGRSSD
jgi:UDP-N-acetylmuramate dehydrogenase